MQAEPPGGKGLALEDLPIPFTSQAHFSVKCA